MGTLRLRTATAADLPFIMETERLPANRPVLGMFEEAQHLDHLADPGWAYLLGVEDVDINPPRQGAREDEPRTPVMRERPAGFALVADLAERNGNVCLRRFAAAEAGRGIGSALLPRVLDWVFSRPASHRFWMRLTIDNHPARRLYEKCGFKLEGVQRQAALRDDGSRVDMLLMSILRLEWPLSIT